MCKTGVWNGGGFLTETTQWKPAFGGSRPVAEFVPLWKFKRLSWILKNGAGNVKAPQKSPAGWEAGAPLVGRSVLRFPPPSFFLLLGSLWLLSGFLYLPVCLFATNLLANRPACFPSRCSFTPSIANPLELW